MEKSMKNEYCITWELYKSWTIENMLKGTRLAFLIFWCLFGSVLLCAGIITKFNVYFLLLAVYCFYRAFLRNLVLSKKQYHMLSKTYGQENWKRAIVFEEENITLTEGTVSAKFLYSDIADIREKENKIWLIFNNKTVIWLYKSAFINTDWAECKAEILAKRA